MQVAALAANLYAASKAKCTLLSGEGKELRDAILQAGQLVVTTPGRLCEVGAHWHTTGLLSLVLTTRLPCKISCAYHA